MDLIQLVESAKKGDKVAFSKLFTMYYTPVYRFLVSRSRDENLALDLTQDVFLRWYNSLNRYNLPSDEEATPLPYLYTIAKRLLINHVAKKKSVMMPEGAEEFIADDRALADELLDIKLNIEEIYEYFEYLTDSEREFIELKYLSELENKEISDIMGKSVDALRQIEHRALKKLRKYYNEK